MGAQPSRRHPVVSYTRALPAACFSLLLNMQQTALLSEQAMPLTRYRFGWLLLYLFVLFLVFVAHP